MALVLLASTSFFSGCINSHCLEGICFSSAVMKPFSLIMPKWHAYLCFPVTAWKVPFAGQTWFGIQILLSFVNFFVTDKRTLFHLLQICNRRRMCVHYQDTTELVYNTQRIVNQIRELEHYVHWANALNKDTRIRTYLWWRCPPRFHKGCINII